MSKPTMPVLCDSLLTERFFPESKICLADEVRKITEAFCLHNGIAITREFKDEQLHEAKDQLKWAENKTRWLSQ